MTRETKIGLLVGLAFIIVIGILLSDHLTNTNEPQQASLTGAGNSVRQAVSTPGGAGVSGPVIVVAPPVAPGQTVATQGELTKAPPAVQNIHIGGPSVGPNVGPAAGSEQTQSQPTRVAPKNQDTVVPPQPFNVVAKNTTKEEKTVTDSDLAKVAAQNGQELISANQPTDPADSTMKTYTARPGDSVSKVVGRMMGSSNKSNIAAFLKANPSMDGDATKFFAGQTYNIPTVSTSAAATPVAPKTQVDDAPDAPPAKAIAKGTDTPSDSDDVIKETRSAKTAADTTYVYTVKAGDNLTKIARDQLGDVHAVASIQELNGEKLKGAKRDIVLVGMKLKLPGKPVVKAD